MADTIVAKNEGGTYQLAPAGQYQAVCCDVVDLGIVETTWKGNIKKVHKCAIIFQLDELDDKGKRYEVAERFTVSMYDAARLRKFLGDWRGKSYTDEEAEVGAPLHKLEGINALVQIEHNTSNGKTYANVGSIMKAPKGAPTMSIKDYTRAALWKKAEAPPPEPQQEQQQPEDDDDLPF
jgi:hypothetical protein